MNNTPVFRCCVCHEVIANPRWSLDRNTQKYRTIEMDGKTLNAINIAFSQEMFIYDSQSCWKAHEPTIVKEMKLKTTYPPSTPLMTSCCRCGDPVDRTKSHVSYAINAMNMEETEDSWIGHFVEGDEFAVLCPNCEEPDAPEPEAAAETADDQERARV